MKEGDTTKRKARVRGAKGAAQAAIGKLIGDDAQIAKGRDEQAAAGKAARRTNKEQE